MRKKMFSRPLLGTDKKKVKLILVRVLFGTVVSFKDGIIAGMLSRTGQT
jgi:hypothetical protein